jgi:hypothetical protein
LEIKESGILETVLINGNQERKKELPPPVKFTEAETNLIYEQAKGKPQQWLSEMIDRMAKAKSLNNQSSSEGAT